MADLILLFKEEEKICRIFYHCLSLPSSEVAGVTILFTTSSSCLLTPSRFGFHLLLGFLEGVVLLALGLGEAVEDGLVPVNLVLLKLMGDHALNRLKQTNLKTTLKFK